jgi:hypothetical protein
MKPLLCLIAIVERVSAAFHHAQARQALPAGDGFAA